MLGHPNRTDKGLKAHIYFLLFDEIEQFKEYNARNYDFYLLIISI